MIKLITTLTLLLLLSSPFSLTASDDILDYLSHENRSTLYSEGEISRYFYDDDQPEYLFKTVFRNELLNDLSNLDISIGVESLYLLKYSDFNYGNSIAPVSIYNTLLSIKTMKGIEYYSQSRKKMRTLFTESYEIVSPDDLKPVADPVIKIIPQILNRYLLQTDKTFGENIYETVYKFEGSAIWVKMVNTTKMKYKFIPMVKPGNMSVNLFILPMEDGLLFYGVSAAETASFFGLEKAKKESFYNRIKAMYNWFSAQLGVNSYQ
ncbi:MAG: hypothetical protein KAR21_21040 [Spirochaetales bacterium]|nr:hypothetical protein [Spirochaetales bacterium]